MRVGILFSTSLFMLSLAVSASAAQDNDLLEKIKKLELQIEELKSLKLRQSDIALKEAQCITAIGKSSLCHCVASGLQPNVSFEHYIHYLVNSKETLGYDKMSADNKSEVDNSISVRDNCIEKGIFK